MEALAAPCWAQYGLTQDIENVNLYSAAALGLKNTKTPDSTATSGFV